MNDRTKDYVFLSYSHAEQDEIKKIVAKFDDHSYNLVYDESLSYGDEWDLSVRRYISSSKCKGVIFIISENFLKSKAILTEVEYTAKFNRKFFSIMLYNMSLPELKNTFYEKLSENEKYIMDSIQEVLNNEQLYLKLNEINWERIGKTFKEWNFFPEKNDTGYLIQPKYSSQLKGEKERLFNQQQGYMNFDMKAIDSVLDELTGDDLCVLDLGCSNGDLTFSRFKDIKRITKVIGIDYNENDIREANAKAKNYGDKFHFYTADLEDGNIITILQNILAENNIKGVDIVFAALVIHHLNNPHKLLLSLYEIFGDDGRIIIRGSDDGGKLCYPKTNLLKEILERYEKLVTASDRSNGRKLYSQLYDTGYTNIRMLYSVVDTCEKDRRRKERLYEVGFSFRLKRIEDLLNQNPNNEWLKNEYDWFKNALNEFKDAFLNRSFWYCNTSYIAIGGIK